MSSVLFLPQNVLLFVTLLWGSTFVATKHMLKAQVPAVLYVTLRYVFGGLTLLLVLPHVEKKHHPPQGLFTNIGSKALALGFLQAIGIVLQAVGQKYTTVPKSSFLTSFSVPLTPLLAWLLLRDRPQRWQMIAIGLGALGMLLLSYPSDALSFNMGDGLTLGSAVVYGITTVQTARWARPAFALRLAAAQTIVAAGILLLFWVLVRYSSWGFLAKLHTEEYQPWVLTWPILLIWAYMSLVCIAITFPLQNWAMARIHANQAAVIFAVEPVFATILALIFLDAREEWPGIRGIIGAALIMAAVVVSEIKRKNHKLPPPHPSP